MSNLYKPPPDAQRAENEKLRARVAELETAGAKVVPVAVYPDSMTRGEVYERGYENGRHDRNGSPLASRHERCAIGGGFGVRFNTAEYLRLAPHWIAGWRQAKRELDPRCGL